MTELLKKSQREYLRHLVLDCTLQRFSTQESLDYIYSKLRTRISERYLFRVKKQIIESAGNQLEYLSQTRNAYFAQYFERINEGYKYQRELWKIYNKNSEDTNCQLKCLLQLKEVSAYLSQLHDYIPDLAGLRFTSNEEGLSKFRQPLPFEPPRRISSGSYPPDQQRDYSEDPEAKF